MPFRLFNVSLPPSQYLSQNKETFLQNFSFYGHKNQYNIKGIEIAMEY